MQEGQIDLQLEGYYQYWNYAVKKGYSGTAVFTKVEPLSVRYGIGDLNEEEEGRILTLEFSDFYLVNVYAPNAQRRFSAIAISVGMGRKDTCIFDDVRQR